MHAERHVTTGATSYRRGRLTLARLDFDRLARPALVVAVIVSGLLLLHLTRGTSFWADDWLWIATRRGNTVDAFLAPYNGHLSLVPIAIYRLMFAVFGIGSYTPYRVLVIMLSLLVAVLVFTYARTRTGDTVALLAAALMLFLAPGWQDTMWAFQIPWLIVCAAGIVALMLIERRTGWADACACGLTLLAICSTSLGIAFAIGIPVDLALTRRRWRDAWIVGIPLVVYVMWTLHYHPSLIDVTAIPTIPLNIAQAAATALSSLGGLSGIRPFDATGTSLTYGWPLLVIASVFVLWRARTVRPSTRAVSLAVTFAVFAASVSIAHGELAAPLSSRYIYVYCVLAALLAVELARGIRRSRLVEASLCVVTLAAVLANIGGLRAFGAYIRGSGATTNGALTALDLDRGSADPSTVARIALYQFVKLSARSYFDAERTLGTPAYTIAQLQHADALARSAADSQLLADGDVMLTSSPTSAVTPRSPVGAGTAVPALAAANGTVARGGACIRFTPAAALAPGSAASVSLIVLPGRLSVTAAAAPATLSIRRFASTFTPLGTLGARRSTILTVRRDSASDPWYLELSSIAPLQACTLRP
jgi:hypothetical protein